MSNPNIKVWEIRCARGRKTYKRLSELSSNMNLRQHRETLDLTETSVAKQNKMSSTYYEGRRILLLLEYISLRGIRPWCSSMVKTRQVWPQDGSLGYNHRSTAQSVSDHHKIRYWQHTRRAAATTENGDGGQRYFERESQLKHADYMRAKNGAYQNGVVTSVFQDFKSRGYLRQGEAAGVGWIKETGLPQQRPFSSRKRCWGSMDEGA